MVLSHSLKLFLTIVNNAEKTLTKHDKFAEVNHPLLNVFHVFSMTYLNLVNAQPMGIRNFWWIEQWYCYETQSHV